MRLFRGMRADANRRPQAGSSANMLGVRPGYDVKVRDGLVQPLTGGMSTMHRDPRKLPACLRPPSLKGSADFPLFSLVVSDLPDTLAARNDKGDHHLIEPSRACSLSLLQTELAGTGPAWTEYTP